MSVVEFSQGVRIPGFAGAFLRLSVSAAPHTLGSQTCHVKGAWIQGTRLLVSTPNGMFHMPTDAGVITGWIY